MSSLFEPSVSPIPVAFISFESSACTQKGVASWLMITIRQKIDGHLKYTSRRKGTRPSESHEGQPDILPYEDPSEAGSLLQSLPRLARSYRGGFLLPSEFATARSSRSRHFSAGCRVACLILMAQGQIATSTAAQHQNQSYSRSILVSHKQHSQLRYHSILSSD